MTPTSENGHRLPSGHGAVAPARPRHRAAPALVAACAVVALVAGWSVSAGAASGTVDVGTNATFGSILTDAGGFALYTLNTDHNGMSTCTGSCAQVWPALTVPAGTAPSAGPGVPGTVTVVTQANGTDQVTYDGAPLYTFLSDSSPGQVTGNGVAGFAVVRLTATTPPTTTPTTAPSTPTTAPPTPTPTTVSSSPTSTRPPATAPGGSNAPESSGSPNPTGASSPPAAPAATGSLAFTGPGPGLLWLAVAGGGLLLAGIVVLVRTRGRALLRHER
ncbi:MAG: hypothetical protein ABSG81_10450 [Acidimicrobiales bacterium]|jgi:predicted lipoprotein with Yx(FWY)xxD motif